MAEVARSIDVNVPIAAAYDQWTRFESFPRFMSGVRSVERLDDGRTHWLTEVAGKHLEFDAEITALEPVQRVAWKSVGEGTEHAGEVLFEQLGDFETRVTVQLTWEPEGLAEKAGSVLGLDGMQVNASLEQFKAYIEDNRVSADERYEAGSALRAAVNVPLDVAPGQA